MGGSANYLRTQRSLENANITVEAAVGTKGFRLKDRPDLSAPSTCKKKKCLYVLVLIEITASDPSKDTGPFLEMQDQEAGQRLKKVDCVKEELRIFITCRTILN